MNKEQTPAKAAKGPAQEHNQPKKGHYQKWHCWGQSEGKKKDPEAIPILKYGPSNNYTLFKEALANTALKEYGALGKLIKERDEYKEPEEPKVENYNLDDDEYGINKAKFIEDLKDYRKEINELKRDHPKLYGLITQYLSEESLDEIKQQDTWEKVDEAADPVGLWKLVDETLKVNTISKVKTVTKLAARTTYKGLRQGGLESIIAYKERFNAALKGYNDQKNSKIEDVDIAMDFFNGLDNGRYASFKAEIVNGLTAGSIQQPADLNAMYLLANQCLKRPKAIQPEWQRRLILHSTSKNLKNSKTRKTIARRSRKVARNRKERRMQVRWSVLIVGLLGIMPTDVHISKKRGRGQTATMKMKRD